MPDYRWPCPMRGSLSAERALSQPAPSMPQDVSDFSACPTPNLAVYILILDECRIGRFGRTFQPNVLRPEGDIIATFNLPHGRAGCFWGKADINEPMPIAEPVENVRSRGPSALAGSYLHMV